MEPDTDGATSATAGAESSSVGRQPLHKVASFAMSSGVMCERGEGEGDVLGEEIVAEVSFHDIEAVGLEEDFLQGITNLNVEQRK